MKEFLVINAEGIFSVVDMFRDKLPYVIMFYRLAMIGFVKANIEKGLNQTTVHG